MRAISSRRVTRHRLHLPLPVLRRRGRAAGALGIVLSIWAVAQLAAVGLLVRVAMR